MKAKKIKIYASLIVIFVTFSSFVLLSTTLQDRTANYVIRHNSTVPAAFIPLLPTTINQMSPSAHVNNAPTMVHGGLTGGTQSTFTQDGNIVVFQGFSSNTGVLASVLRQSISGSIHTEFDLRINSNFSGTFSNGATGGGHDRATVLRHEFGHGVGLDHTGTASRLMGASLGVNQVKNIGQDEIRGYNCIYNNICTGQEGGSGNLEFSTDIVADDLFKTLKWSVETDNNDLLGFNVYKKECDGSLISVNSEMIKFRSNQAEYTFQVDDTKDTYYVEVVGEAQLDKRMFKF
ncbi:hypothetical protein KORDIASMS9_02955 [Kordia sp. SMS9]|uniref:matrixin family metalloprotease n=1 Tax=Kordia sp. SMS9 TaxID=2282170 RepID=UPI000E0D109B|nr:matrixin family metalloprotease [Kordia sp. SMS9]AXG70709.1 hypothetical protein KORDIASMS9_02955 [Kordia sp. SMS9]